MTAPGNKMTEKGKLPVGVEYEGKLHRDFELRPQLVSDSVDALEESERAQRNENYLGLCVLARQLVKLGEIPGEKITPGLLMGMYALDLEAITTASGRLAARMARFPGKDETSEEGHAGAKEDRVQRARDSHDERG